MLSLVLYKLLTPSLMEMDRGCQAGQGDVCIPQVIVILSEYLHEEFRRLT